jgi:hypothetical protein
MKKVLITFFSCLTFAYFFNNNISLAQNSFKAYSVVTNPHGIVIKTSIGVFYLGNNKDAIHEASGYRRYGYWEANSYRVRIYISDEI